MWHWVQQLFGSPQQGGSGMQIQEQGGSGKSAPSRGSISVQPKAPERQAPSREHPVHIREQGGPSRER